MGILVVVLFVVLLAAWGPAPAAAQPCEPSNCWWHNDKLGQKATAKPKKTAAMKKPKKQAQEIYMKAVPY